MRSSVWLLLVLAFTSVDLLLAANQQAESAEDNDFAEFEDIDDDEITVTTTSDNEESAKTAPKVVMAPEAAAAASQQESDSTDEDDVTVEDDEEDFEHLNDEDEFEGFDKERTPKKSHDQPPDLKITKVPMHLHTNWDSFYMEMLMLGGLAAYLLNFLAGKNKNHKLAQSWLSAHRQLLEDNFAIIGDDGTTTEPQSGVLMKEAENVYALWCSGRVYCEGMLVTLKLLKRQDLVSSIARLLRPVNDQIIIKVILDDSEFESFVFCLAHKRVCSTMQKDHQDLGAYCSEKKTVEKYGLSANFQILSESSQVTSYVLDNRVVAAIQKHEPMIEYLHFSDQYVGPRQPEENQAGKVPETSRVLIFCFNIVDPSGKSGPPRDIEQMKPLLKMVFYCIDKMKRLKLSKEAKAKADRNRQKALETLQKAAHSQRTEAAQNRREEKRRAEKEKIMNEDDPDKQRKLEEKNLKKEAKKKQPKLKKMKIKAL
jgi:hypothetical protein